MKKIITLLIGIAFSTTILICQEAPPQAFSYKATITKSNGSVVTKKNIGLQLSILKNSIDGIAVYIETFNPTTSEYGQIDIEIGNGTVVLGDFPSIEWSTSKFFLKTEVDVKGGTVYELLSVIQLLSVPYALYSDESGLALSADYNTLSNKPSIPTKVSELDNDVPYLTTEVDGSITNEIQNLTDVLAQGNDAGSSNITNLADPVNDQDAATKSYIDQMKAEILTQIAGDKVTDYDGNSYNTVKIGNQIWMAENLKVIHYPDGTPIIDEYPIFSFVGGYFWYEKDFDNDADIDSQDSLYYVDNYGFLYSWPAIMRGEPSSNSNPSGVQGVCPTGWHLPSHDEWFELERYLGMDSTAAYNKRGFRGTDQGTKLKEGGITGFNALFGGHHWGVTADPPYFHSFGVSGFYWTCTMWTYNQPHNRFFFLYNSGVSNLINTASGYKWNHKSIRCVKDP